MTCRHYVCRHCFMLLSFLWYDTDMIFQTKRLILRPWEESDAEELFRWAQDPLIGPAAGWNALRSLDDAFMMIRGQYARPEVYAVCLIGETEESGQRAAKPIGCLSLKFGDDTELTNEIGRASCRERV